MRPAVLGVGRVWHSGDWPSGWSSDSVWVDGSSDWVGEGAGMQRRDGPVCWVWLCDEVTRQRPRCAGTPLISHALH